ncbi:glycosyltransferase family 2 protein [Acidimangrovimonas pyrenivorans]|uniref:Glycosyltransferase family 2 protein n=1 Tax=Acidimangrovimonas pyrenivorans TaxID=2030798 RepID=A0ABV7AGP0_9RHOB
MPRPSAEDQTAPPLMRRSLRPGRAGGLCWLDAVRWPAGDGRDRFRAMFATGTRPDAFDPAPRPGCAGIEELREVSGGVMVCGSVAQGAALRLATAAGEIALETALAETGFLAGRDVLLGLRLEEPVETVRDWLDYHARHHGARGAVIVNRAPPDSPAGSHDAFAADLAEAVAALPRELRVVVLDSPVPLGKPGLGPESHPFLAPDAPGKDRMAPPDPDPWRAPLGEGLIYEIAKWRFLARAAAVANLDVTDLFAPRAEDTPTAFALARDHKSGVVLVAGKRIYPWRVRNGAAESFGDHICHQFDNRRGMVRWCVAPEVAGLENTWRALRIAYAKPDPQKVVPFFRCMGLRVPGRNSSELAPKTSLVEDPLLLDMARGVFGAKPVRPPRSDRKPAPRKAAEAGRTAIVTTMKNEGPFILEWLAYHRAIGVEDFLIYTNDCSDGTDTMLDLLQRKGLVQHRANPWRPGGALKPQHAALQAAESEPAIENAGWVICMDVDEFIDIKIGDGTLAALYEAMGEANMISLTWRLFGNADVHEYEDRFMIEQFPLCAPELVRKPHQAWGFKTLFRNIGIYKKMGVHRPKGLKPDLWPQIRWLNGSGRRMPIEMLRNGWRSSLDTYGYDWVSLNHYAVRSAESFLVKRDRGRVNHVDRDQGLNYWFRMNHNAVEERSIQRMIPALRAEFDRLLADPEIRAAHEHSVACHRAKIAELRARPDQEAFYAALTGERMQRLSRMLHHFGANVFNAGPQVIPEDLHRRELPRDFFFTVEHRGEAKH